MSWREGVRADLVALEEQVLALQADAAGDFARTRAAVVAWQGANNPAVAGFWARRGFDPARSGTMEVPAVPTDVFKVADLGAPVGPVLRTFRTSGTTVGDRGAHPRRVLEAYRAGAVRHFGAWSGCLPGSTRWVKLVFDGEEVPDSSLSWMVDRLEEAFGAGPRQPGLLGADGLRLEAADQTLQEAAAGEMPVVVFGTTFGLMHWLEESTLRVRLPAGSMLVDTGGTKGRSREVSRPQLVTVVEERLGIPRQRCGTEYSMTELSSQLWAWTGDDGEPLPLVPPRWLRVEAADPENLAVLPRGQMGLLRMDDLANTDTVVAVQTSDLGVVHDDGTVTLMGRAPGATPRGCSLAVEEVLARLAGAGRGA
jgi:hypothetical protein